MTDPGSLPKRHWRKFRLRTLLLLVAAIGLVLGTIRWTVWRSRVDRAIEASVAQGHTGHWTHSWEPIAVSPRLFVPPYDPFELLSQDEVSFLQSDPQRVLETLLQIVEHDPDDMRRVRAVRMLRSMLGQSPSLTQSKRKGCLDDVLQVAAHAALPPLVEAELAEFLSAGVLSMGLDGSQRKAILARAANASPELIPVWALVLAEIGGREETGFLVRLGGTHDATLQKSIHYLSVLRRSAWPGLLPHLKTWLDDPALVATVLPWHGYELFAQHPEGRDLLFAYATDASHPLEKRRYAVQRLQETVPGTELLLAAEHDPQAWAVLTEGISGDARAKFQAALTEHRGWYGHAFWSELITGVEEPSLNAGRKPTTDAEKASAERRERFERARRQSCLRCLQWLTGRTDLHTRADWQRWYDTTQPPALALHAYAELALRHPEALDNYVLTQRIVLPDRLGSMPPECLPLYKQLAQQEPLKSRFFAFAALLDSVPMSEVVPDMIDVIAEGPPNADSPSYEWSLRILRLLRNRFAENFFWDAAAWRAWWAEYQNEERKPD